VAADFGGAPPTQVFGAGMAAAISTYTYHPHTERDFGIVADVWITQMGWDVGTYTVKEFWPDLCRRHHENPSQNRFYPSYTKSGIAGGSAYR
jgi:hypothetical protein